jgi:hypothetical protein
MSVVLIIVLGIRLHYLPVAKKDIFQILIYLIQGNLRLGGF